MLPVLNLHMKDKCEISSEWPLLRMAKGAYAAIGWVIVALATFTCMGLLGRLRGY